MRRNLLVTALIFVTVGFAAGYLYTRYAGTSRRAAPAAPVAEPSPVLPEGQPPLDVAQRWRALEERARANPRDPQAALELANFLFDIERLEDAAFWYRRALELDPNNTSARTDLATCYYHLNRYEEAISTYSAALQLEPDKPQALYGLALARLRGRRDRAGARQAYEQLRRRHPEFPGVELLAEQLNQGSPPR